MTTNHTHTQAGPDHNSDNQTDGDGDEVELPRVAAPRSLIAGDYRNELTICHRFAVDPHDEMRYEHTRSMLADWLSEASDAAPKTFATCTFDVWLGQHSEQGRFGPSMNVILAVPTGGKMPSPKHQAWLTAQPSHVFTYTGCDHIALGSFPALRVAKGEFLHSWFTRAPFLYDCAVRFREIHKLVRETNTPYRQMSMGADEPQDFAWLRAAEHKVG